MSLPVQIIVLFELRKVGFAPVSILDGVLQSAVPCVHFPAGKRSAVR